MVGSAAPALAGELRRELGFGSAVAALAGECIAVGIFLTPAGMAKALGSPLLMLLVWCAMGAACAAGAICYGELASRYPYPGGTYVYLREGYGEGTAFVYGWMAMLIMDPGVTAAMALGMMGYFGAWIPLTLTQRRVIAVAFIVILAAVNMLSTRAGASVMRSITWLKFALIAALPLLPLLLHAGSWSNLVPFAARRPGSAPLLPALTISVVGAFYSFGGWWDASKLAGEIRDRRVLSRAFIVGVSLVTAAYVLISGVFLWLVPLQQVTSDQGFVAQAGQVLFGARGAQVFSAMVIACVAGGIAVMIMAAPRVYYAMARDRVFFSRFGRLSRFGTPVYAIAIQAVLTCVLIFTGSFESVVSYFLFPVIFFIAMTVAAVLKRNVVGRASHGFVLPGAIYLLMSAVIEVLIMAAMPRQALIGSAVVLMGIPVWYAVRTGLAKAAEEFGPA